MLWAQCKCSLGNLQVINGSYESMLQALEALKCHLPFSDTYFKPLSCQQVSAMGPLSESLLNLINHMQH